MSAKEIKGLAACAAGAMLAAWVGGWVYSSVVAGEWGWPSGLGFDALLDAVERMPWAKMAMAQSAMVAFVECVLIKRARLGAPFDRWIGALAGLIAAGLVFLALCAMSNGALIKGSAVVFIISLLIASLVIMGMEISAARCAALKTPGPSKAFRAAAGAALLLAALGLSMAADSASSMGREVARVAAKHEARMKELGFAGARQIRGDHWRQWDETRVEEKRGSELAFDGLLLPRSAALEALGVPEDKQDAFDNPFAELELSFSGGRLRVSGLRYDKEALSQEELARMLDAVMSKAVMPRLERIREEADKREANERSHRAG